MEKIIDLPYLEREIGCHTYRCDRHLLKDWIELETLLIRVLDMQVLDMDEGNLGAYAPRILGAATKADHEQIFDLLSRSIKVQNPEGGWSMISRQTQDRWWPAFIGELPGALGMYFEIQFADFFRGLARLLPEGEN